MEDKKRSRLESILKTAITIFIAQEANKNSLITVNHIETNKIGTIANVYFSVYPTEEAPNAAAFLNRKAFDCKKYIKKTHKLQTIPTIRFKTTNIDNKFILEK